MSLNLPSQNNTIAFFDFDGTVTTKDSFFAFLRFTQKPKDLVKIFLYLWPILLLYKLRILSNSKAKKIVYCQFYQNWQFQKLQEKSTEFCDKILPGIINAEALAKLSWHKQQGHRVLIVSAMFQPVLKPWCTSQKIELIATDLEIKNGYLTGKFSTPNCYGQEKVNRILELDLLQKNPFIYAYGDSEGDKELLALAHKAFYRKFK